MVATSTIDGAAAWKTHQTVLHRLVLDRLNNPQGRIEWLLAGAVGH